MPEVRYYWNIDTMPPPNQRNLSVEDIYQKLFNKFGTGKIVIAGDKTRLAVGNDTSFGKQKIWRTEMKR